MKKERKTLPKPTWKTKLEKEKQKNGTCPSTVRKQKHKRKTNKIDEKTRRQLAALYARDDLIGKNRNGTPRLSDSELKTYSQQLKVQIATLELRAEAQKMQLKLG